MEREAEGGGRDASRGDESNEVDVGEISVRGGGGLLSEDECGICGFGVGDLRAAAGGGAERDSAAGGGAGSGGAAADSSRAAGDADRVSAVAVAGSFGARAQSG